MSVDTEQPVDAEVTLTAKRPKGKRTRWTFSLGALSEMANPADGDQRRRAAKRLGVTEEAILSAVEAVGAAPEGDEADVVSATQPEPACKAWRQGDATKVYYDTVGEALRTVGPEKDFLSWEWGDGPDPAMVCVDVDLTPKGKEQGGWTEEDARRLLFAPGPLPRYSWLSRSGGWHGLFFGGTRYGLTALQRAGLWVLMSPSITADKEWTDKVERVPVTRFPHARVEGTTARKLYTTVSEYGTQDLPGRLLRTGKQDAASEAEIVDWLAERDLERGGEYPHTRCPISPSDKGNKPVNVYDSGVNCFHCGGGVRGWAWLIGTQRRGGQVSPAVDMARNLTHWSHARFVLEAEHPGTDLSFLRGGYEALVTVLHWGKREDEKHTKRRRAVFARWPMIRGVSCWLRPCEVARFAPVEKVSRPTLAALPSTGGHPAFVDVYAGSQPLTGYPPILPVLHVVPEDRPTWHRGGDVDAGLVGRHVSTVAHEVISLDEARETVCNALPGVTEQWLMCAYVVLVAAIRAQLNLPEPPSLVVEAPSGAGKGAMLAFVEGCLGAKNHSLKLDGDEQECVRSAGTGLSRGAALLVADEIGKVGNFWRKSRVLLEMTTRLAWRPLYIDQAVTPVRAAVVLMGSTLPRSLLGMQEVARRACFLTWGGISSDSSGKWAHTVRDAFGGRVDLSTLRDSPVGAAVAEAFVTAAREEVMRENLPSWPEQGAALGAERLQETPDALEREALVLALYELWCTAPESAIVRSTVGKGWLAGTYAEGGAEVAEILAQWADPEEPARIYQAKIDELATSRGPHDSLRLMIRKRGRTRTHVRFQSSAPGCSRSLDRHNREIFPWPIEKVGDK